MDMKLIDRIKRRKEIKEKLKKQGRGSFNESVKHAISGIEYTITHERNFKIETVIAILVCIASIYFKINITEWMIILLTIALVLTLEIINTSIERSIDLVTKEYAELAKVAKDTAAGAVFVMSIFSVCIGISIFLPKIINWIGGMIE